MKNKTQRNIRLCSIIVLVLCGFWAVFKLLRFIGFFTGMGGLADAVDWSQNTMSRIAFFAVDFLSAVVTIGLCVKVALNTLKGAKENTAFPQSNVKLLFWLSLAFFVYLLCWRNEPMLYHNEFGFGLVHTNFILPFCLLFFAFMYKVAADAVEENNLTV